MNAALFILPEQKAIQANGTAIAAAIMQNWKSLISNSGTSQATKATYTANAKPFLSFVGNSIAPDSLAAYRDFLSTEICSISTKNARLAAATAIIKAAHRRGILPIDISSGIRCFKASRGHKKSGLTTAQVRNAVTAIQEKKSEKTRIRLMAMFALMAWEGFRQCEVCRLEIADINTSEGFVMVHGKGMQDKQRFPIHGKPSKHC
jgi:site-specific recombinase XerD